MPYSAREISPAGLYTLLNSNEEHALIDVRETDPFSQNHLLFAVPVPLARLEMLVADLLPRTTLPIIICDDETGLAQRAAERLGELGYQDVSVLKRGITGWLEAGYETFSGVNVPSKAFGEFVEHEQETPSLSAEELSAMIQSGDDLVILDSRPFEEFNWASIPGGVCCAGAELVYRAPAILTSADTTVVVNCAGRTRSIIGAQSLINAGLPNRVFALRNGIMGWRLAGFQPANGISEWAPSPAKDGLEKAKAAAARVAGRYHIDTIDQSELDQWRAERDTHTLYILDVRTIEEFETGHLDDATHAPGGQLIQATDQYIGARNARLVLVDNDGVRATMTASWLIQMGQRHVRVLDLALDSMPLTVGKRVTPALGLNDDDVQTIAVAQLPQKLQQGALVVDLSLSPDYKRGHIPGAWFAQRSRAAESLSMLPDPGQIVLTSSDGVLAELAANEFQVKTDVPVFVLSGGNAAWVQAGNSLVADDQNFCVEPNDVWRIPFSANAKKGQSVEDSMQAYLDWEVDLVDQVKRDGTTRFKHFPGPLEG